MVSGSDFMTALQATSYFEKDNYYLKDGATEKGQWYGKTAEPFGESGEINMKHFYELANGIKPRALSTSEYHELRNLDKEAAKLQKMFDSIENLPPVKRLTAKLQHEERLNVHNELRKSFNDRLGKENKLIADTTAKKEDGGLHMHQRAGYDLTFSAPKSASIMALVAGDKRLIDAHEEATNRVMHYLEKHFSQARIGSGENRSLETTGNILAAQFTHYTSRSAGGEAPDPQLHTHNFIFNVTQTSEGIRSIENKEMLKAIKLAGQLYQNEYATLVKQLGYETEWHKTGSNMTFEIKGIERDMIDHYSKRHSHLESIVTQREEKLGRKMTKAEKVALKRELVTKTRSSKEPQDLGKLEASWTNDLSEKFGLNAEDIKRSTAEQIPGTAIEKNLLAAAIKSVAFTDDNKSVFTQHDLLLEMAKMSMGSNSIDALSSSIRDHAKQRLANDTDTYVVGRAANNSETILYSSKSIIDAEACILDRLHNGKGTGSIVDDDRFIELYTGVTEKLQTEATNQGHDFYSLTNGQFTALKHIMTHSDRIIGIQGDAGTGKTTLLKYLNKSIGGAVDLVGVSKTAKAAKEIEHASGISSMTIDRFLTRDEEPSGRQRILIVDESSMGGTKQISDLLAKAGENTKIVFVGDEKQLKAVDAGDFFTKLKQHGMATVEMTESIRHKTEITKNVANLLKNVENVGRAIEELDAAGKLVSDEKEFGKIFATNTANDYAQNGMMNVISLVSTNKERREYNMAIREILKESGSIGIEDFALTTFESKRLSGADKIFAGSYGIGDKLISRKMQGDLKSGTTAEIVNVDKNSNTLEIRYMTRKGEKAKWLSADKLDVFEAFEAVEKPFAIGDKISFERNEKKNFEVENGQTGIIKNIDIHGNLSVETADGRTVVFNIGEYRNIDHAYSMTTHKSQGQSVDHVHILADADSGLNVYNAGYVQLTRSIRDVHLYTNDRAKLEKKYGIVSTPDNAVDYLGKSALRDAAELDKVLTTARHEADKKHNEAKTFQPAQHDRSTHKMATKTRVRRTREGQLNELDKKLIEFGRIDLNKSYSHAVMHGYASSQYVKALSRMDKRLGQLVTKGYVTKIDKGIYVLNHDKKADFHRYTTSFSAVVDRADAAASNWSEDFKQTYKRINTKKAFLGRRYGRPAIQREVNAGIDSILNEAYAGSVALITATTKFAARKILKLGMDLVTASFAKNIEKVHDIPSKRRSKFGEKLEKLVSKVNSESLIHIQAPQIKEQTQKRDI